MNMSQKPHLLLVKVPSYSDVIAPPLGLGYLAAAVRDSARVSLLDGVRLGLTPKKLYSTAKSLNPDMVGFSVVSAAKSPAVQCIGAVRKALPKAVILAGGPHPTAMPMEFLEETAPHLDFVLRGEAEEGLRILCREFPAQGVQDISPDDLNKIPGMAAIGKDTPICRPPAVREDINDPAMPAWDLMPPGQYPKAPHGAFFRRFPVAPALTSRGCSYGCGFCSVPALTGGKIRFRAPQLVAEELMALKTRFGVQEAQIIDDNFTANKAHALNTCRALINSGVNLPWTCPNGVRMENLDKELIQAMKGAGCYSVSLGLESGSAKVLNRMKKGLSLDHVGERVELLAKAGLEVNGFFILGYPEETRQDMKATLDFAKSLPLTRANFSLFTPLPGCPEWERLSADPAAMEGLTTTFSQVGYVPQGFSRSSLKRQQRKAFLGFYLQRRNAERLLASLRSREAVYYFARRAWHWMGAS
ncbi:Radical SAM domain protein [Desulfatibacillum aliphaticivorans]|uniref:Radical SAM domain protein n=2 Tax=Desulfatibacillum aliphaticivorans TaxID=218208 RepID=B8F9C5_DESAL|nr:Radical SAM domain protein [Desulfatibacillum aliphaticivorans]